MTLVERFEQHAAQSPDKVAITFEGETLTYKALNERAKPSGVSIT